MAYSGEGKLIEAEIEGDTAKTIRSLVCDAEGHLLVDTTNMSVITGQVLIEDSTGHDLTSINGSLNVNVTNPQTITPEKSTFGTIVDLEIDTLPTLLLSDNPLRKNLILCTQSMACFVSTEINVSSNHFSFYLAKQGYFDLANYTGPLWACTASGICPIKVTEFI